MYIYKYVNNSSILKDLLAFMFLSIKIILKKPLLLSSIDSFLKLYNSKKIIFFCFILQDKPNHQYNTKKIKQCYVGAMAVLNL